MQHAAIDNQTDFAFAHLFSYDEKGRPLVVSLLQAIFAIVPGASRAGATHRLEPLGEQPPVNLLGRPWEPVLPDPLSPDPEPQQPDVVSYRIEPCFAFTKPATDVVLVGHAHAPASDTRHMRVGLKVGSLEKVVVVHGDRAWQQKDGELVPSEPQTFERIPLRYERAFGGWDRSHPDPDEHHCLASNPVGLGYRKQSDGKDEPCDPPGSDEGLRLPNLEDPEDPIERPGQIVKPAGFGFVSPSWEPRSKLAGTYDEAWMEERMPYLASDFDRRFFNAASPGLIADGYLTGHEPVAIFGATRDPHLLFSLPGVRPLTCTVERTKAGDAVHPMPLDTIILDTDDNLVTLWFRSHALLRDGPRDVRTIRVAHT